MEIIYLPFLALIAIPPLALVPATVFGFCFRRHRQHLAHSGRRLIAAATLAWLLYALYESVMWIWSRDVIAPIRVDLLVIAPSLYVLSLLGARACLRVRKTE